MTTEPPQVFMSYSHESEEHRDWVLQLSTRLRGNGVDVCLDRWNVSLGGNLAHYMERAADHSYRVIAVVSETYSVKCNDRSGGPGRSADALGECGLGTVYVYRDPADIANVAVMNRARERTECLADVSQFETSSRVVNARAGDAIVLHNRNGFWALAYITKVYAREALNRELVIKFHYEIRPDRTPDFSGFEFPDTGAQDKTGG